MPIRALRHFAPIAFALVLGACVDLTGLDFVGGRLTAIDVSQGAVVEVGDTVRLTAAGKVDGLMGLLNYDPVLDARWAVADASVAKVEPLPPPPPTDSFPRARTLIRGLRPGTTRVTATARGVTGEATVRVIPVVATIQVKTTRDTLVVGDTITVSAIAFDGAGVPIEGVPITVDVSSGLQIRGYSTAPIRVVAITAGLATVSARFRRVAGGAELVVLPRTP